MSAMGTGTIAVPLTSVRRSRRHAPSALRSRTRPGPAYAGRPAPPRAADHVDAPTPGSVEHEGGDRGGGAVTPDLDDEPRVAPAAHEHAGDRRPPRPDRRHPARGPAPRALTADEDGRAP